MTAQTIHGHFNRRASEVRRGQPSPRSGGNHRDNNFNFIRIVLAALVLLSHSFDLLPNYEQWEPYRRIFGSGSLGTVAVAGFFLLSGFLILQSWQRDPHFASYLQKRALRIYPGFIVCSLICVYFVGRIGGSALYYDQISVTELWKNLVLLKIPHTPPVMNFESVNGSMWTIAHEFHFYLLLALAATLITRFKFEVKRAWPVLAAVILAYSLATQKWASLPLSATIYLLSYFVVGGCFLLWRERLPGGKRAVYAAAALLPLGLLVSHLAQLSLIFLGGFLLFRFAFAHIKALDWFKTSPDISYGLYLYGFPLQVLLIWNFPTIHPLALFGIALVLATICGYFSWIWIEKPVLQFKGKALRPQKTRTEMQLETA